MGAVSTPASGFQVFIEYLTSMSDDEIDDVNSEQPLSDASHFVRRYFAITNHTDAKKSGVQNAVCAFCDKRFSGCSTSRAAAHILGRPVLGHLVLKMSFKLLWMVQIRQHGPS